MSRQDIADAQDRQDAARAAQDKLWREGRKARRRMERELQTLILGPDRLSEALDALAAAPSALPSPGPWRDGGPRRS